MLLRQDESCKSPRAVEFYQFLQFSRDILVFADHVFNQQSNNITTINSLAPGGAMLTAIEWAEAAGHVEVVKTLKRHSIERAVAAARATQAAAARTPSPKRGSASMDGQVTLSVALSHGRARSLDTVDAGSPPSGQTKPTT